MSTPELRMDIPHSARIYDYLLGGAALFEGFELVEPGVVPVHHWHADEQNRQTEDKNVYMYGGAALKRQCGDQHTARVRIAADRSRK